MLSVSRVAAFAQCDASKSLMWPVLIVVIEPFW